jgi:hypothetical protein
MRVSRLLLSFCLLGLFAVTLPGTASAASGTKLMNDVSFYPRSIRLQHSGANNGRIIANVASDTARGADGVIFESTNNGASFQPVGRVEDPWGAAGRGGCCESLFELPQQIGSMPAGTLLWAGSMGRQAGQSQLRIWKSNDIGRTWSYVSSCYVTPNGLGLWEPELSIDAAGRLVCHFADETEQPARSQILSRTVSTDGVNWSGKAQTVASTTSGHRPGMPVVEKLPNGTYYMVYEICGLAGQYHCELRFRTSSDGWNWGAVTDLGRRLTTLDGKYFTHTPNLAWVPNGTPNGRLLLIGQVLTNADGSIAAGNGATMFVNTENGNGNWFEATSPVSVPGARDNVCPNYSSSLLPSVDGNSVLEIATDYDPADNRCKAYYATGSAEGTGDASGVSDGTYRLRNTMSGHCLDVAGGSSQPGGNIQQWTCNDLWPQNFVFTSRGGGAYQLRNAGNGLCVGVAGGSTAPGANVQQETCTGAASQDWLPENAGRGYYYLRNRNSGLYLDNAGGSLDPGTNVAQWTRNELAPEIWKLERR